jgi:hypothetical protein
LEQVDSLGHVNSRYDLSDNLMFSGKELTAAITKNKVYKSTSSIETTTMANQLGLYKAKKQDKHRKNSTIVAYYCTIPDTLPIPPRGNSKWYDNIVSLLPRITHRSSDKTQGDKRGLPMEGLMPATMLAPTQKKKRMGEVLIRNGGTGQFAFTNDPILAHLTNTTNKLTQPPNKKKRGKRKRISNRLLQKQSRVNPGGTLPMLLVCLANFKLTTRKMMDKFQLWVDRSCTGL